MKVCIKRIFIWILGIIIIIAAVLSFFGFLMKCMFVPDDMVWFNENTRESEILNPAVKSDDVSGEENGLAMLLVRTVFNNYSGPNEYISRTMFQPVTDTTYILIDKNGTGVLSSGIFSIVYDGDYKDDSLSYHIQGLINVIDFVKQKDAVNLYSALIENPESRIKINSYIIDENHFICPVSVSLLNKNDDEGLYTVEFDYSGDIIVSDTFFAGSSLSENMRVAFQGELKSDKPAREFLEKISFGTAGDAYEETRGLSYTVCSRYKEKNEIGIIKTSVDDYSACIRRLILLVSLIYSLVLTGIFVIKDKLVRRKLNAKHY